VFDIDNLDAEMTWTYLGNSQLTVDITNRIATITTPSPDWNGAETITFTATDPGALNSSDQATFTVTATNDAPVVSDIPDQTIAEGLFSISLDLGVRKAISIVQESLNLLCPKERTDASLLVDGICGPATLASLTSILKAQESSYLLKIMYLLQGMHYIRYLRKAPDQRTYVKQWLKIMHISIDRRKRSVPATPTGLKIE